MLTCNEDKVRDANNVEGAATKEDLVSGHEYNCDFRLLCLDATVGKKLNFYEGNAVSLPVTGQ